MSDENDEDHIKQVFDQMAKRQRIMREVQEKMEAYTDEQSEKIEKNMLMKLYSDLGDQTETYWQAMTAVAQFVKVLLYAKKKCSKLANPIRIRILRSLAECLIHEAEMVEHIQKQTDEFIRNNEKES